MRYDAKTRDIINEEGATYDITGCHLSDNLWEFYKEPEPDWDYIIKNKCLCWFWDDNVNHKRIYKLAGINKKAAYPFENTTGGVYRHCQPVRKDEVTFYEDKK